MKAGKVRLIVPELVIGEPLTEAHAGTLIATEVTDPVAVTVCQDPSARRNFVVPPPEAGTAPAVEEEKSGSWAGVAVPERREKE